MERAGNQVDVLFISSPWEPASNNLRGMDGKVDKLWKQFRDLSFDHLPVQVRILAIWTALCERYGPRVCVIGHRSGFIEGAGFIGIPIFYLNNERTKIDKGKHMKAGDLLWRTVENPDQDRLRRLANVMNTFIPVEALKREPINGVLRMYREYENELAAALFMYMCCEYYLKPTDMKGSPGWAARVNMMHDKGEDDGHKWRDDLQINETV